MLTCDLKSIIVYMTNHDIDNCLNKDIYRTIILMTLRGMGSNFNRSSNDGNPISAIGDPPKEVQYGNNQLIGRPGSTMVRHNKCIIESVVF